MRGGGDESTERIRSGGVYRNSVHADRGNGSGVIPMTALEELKQEAEQAWLSYRGASTERMKAYCKGQAEAFDIAVEIVEAAGGEVCT